MRSPVQSRVPLLDKNKAFERLPLLGAFFFYTSIGAGLHGSVYTMVYTNANHISIRLNICQIQCGKVQHIKKNSLNLQKIEAIEISVKKSLYSHSIVALGFGDIS